MVEQVTQVATGNATATEAPPKEPGAEEKVDWEKRAQEAEAKLAEAEATHQKLARDFQSLKGTRQRTEDQYTLLQRLQEEMETQSAVSAKNLQALVEAIKSGDADSLETRVATNSVEAAQGRGEGIWRRQYANLYGELVAAVTTEEPLVDIAAERERLGKAAASYEDADVVLMSAPFDDVRTAWLEAAPEGPKTPAPARDYGGLVKALALAHRTVHRLEREQSKVMTEKQVREAREQARQKTLEETGALDLSGGKESGGGSGEQELVNRMGRGEAMTVADFVKASAALDKGILPKR